MKYILFLLLLIINLNLNSEIQHHFKIIIPSYNNSQYYQKNLDSIISQTYKNYEIIYIDDCSTDNTHELVLEYIKRHKISDKIRLLKNLKNLKAGYNRYIGAHLSETSNTVLLFVDGDDWLKHENVLSYLNTIYQDQNIWLTYGQFEFLSGVKSAIHEVDRNTNFRTHPWVTWHLRTCRAALFHRIKLKDFLYQGNFFTMAPDIPESLPMLEMAKNGHIRCIKESLYIYNINQFSEAILDNKKQVFLEKYARSLSPYTPLDSLKEIKITIDKIYFTTKESLSKKTTHPYSFINLDTNKQYDLSEITELTNIMKKTGTSCVVIGSIVNPQNLIDLSPLLNNKKLYAVDLRKYKFPVKNIIAVICENQENEEYLFDFNFSKTKDVILVTELL